MNYFKKSLLQVHYKCREYDNTFLPVSNYIKYNGNTFFNINYDLKNNFIHYNLNKKNKRYVTFHRKSHKFDNAVGFNILKFFVIDYLLKNYPQMSVQQITSLSSYIHKERLNWINANSKILKFKNTKQFNTYIGNYYLESPEKNFDIIKKWITDSIEPIVKIEVFTENFLKKDDNKYYYQIDTPITDKQMKNTNFNNFFNDKISEFKYYSYYFQTDQPQLPKINDDLLLERIFTDRSTDKNIALNNKRLELLGDSVLGFMIIKILYKLNKLKKTTHKNTNFYSWQMLTSNKKLRNWSMKYKFDEFLKINSKDCKNKSKPYADVFEAYLGGLYLQLKSFKEIELWLEQLCHTELMTQ